MSSLIVFFKPGVCPVDLRDRRAQPATPVPAGFHLLKLPLSRGAGEKRGPGFSKPPWQDQPHEESQGECVQKRKE